MARCAILRPFRLPESPFRSPQRETATGLSSLPRTIIPGLDWTGLDWTGLDWTGLDWTGLDWTGLDWMDGSTTLPRRKVIRARALLWAGDGVANAEMARRCQVTPEVLRR